MDKDKLVAEYESAKRYTQACKPESGRAAEKSYGKAFQNLVKAGLATQIKKKYRGGN